MAAHGHEDPPRPLPTVLDVNVFLIPGGGGASPYILVEKGTAFYRMVHLLQVQSMVDSTALKPATMERPPERPNVARAYAHANEDEEDLDDSDSEDEEESGLSAAARGMISFFIGPTRPKRPDAVPMRDAERGDGTPHGGDAFHDRAQQPVVSTGVATVTARPGDGDVRRRGASPESARDTHVVPIRDEASSAPTAPGQYSAGAADATATWPADEDLDQQVLTPVQPHPTLPPDAVVSEWFQVHYIHLWDVFILLRSMKQLDLGVISAIRTGAFGPGPSAQIDTWVEQHGYGILQYSTAVHDTARSAIMARANMSDVRTIRALATHAEILAASQVTLFPTEGTQQLPRRDDADAGAGVHGGV